MATLRGDRTGAQDHRGQMERASESGQHDEIAKKVLGDDGSESAREGLDKQAIATDDTLRQPSEVFVMGEHKDLGPS